MGKFAETTAANLFIESSICAEAAIAEHDVERFVAVSRRCHHAGANAPHVRL